MSDSSKVTATTLLPPLDQSDELNILADAFLASPEYSQLHFGSLQPQLPLTSPLSSSNPYSSINPYDDFSWIPSASQPPAETSGRCKAYADGLILPQPLPQIYPSPPPFTCAPTPSTITLESTLSQSILSAEPNPPPPSRNYDTSRYAGTPIPRTVCPNEGCKDNGPAHPSGALMYFLICFIDWIAHCQDRMVSHKEKEKCLVYKTLLADLLEQGHGVDISKRLQYLSKLHPFNVGSAIMKKARPEYYGPKGAAVFQATLNKLLTIGCCLIAEDRKCNMDEAFKIMVASSDSGELLQSVSSDTGQDERFDDLLMTIMRKDIKPRLDGHINAPAHRRQGTRLHSVAQSNPLMSAITALTRSGYNNLFSSSSKLSLHAGTGTDCNGTKARPLWREATALSIEDGLRRARGLHRLRARTPATPELSRQSAPL
ncbi:uncharacterized protein F5147DRAFT_789386 [Suillus discolor]|uniref:Uncharacterized protein n=1 Tax=Suillus discolor TaxID=1912936 RepID=A0A9P7EU52_9AGAM|nr:uncharacterized protein F5147DRAFT_789386 [Suillus discolor]KAG2088553.1 hypothetical protein F5147DRAFT_789386 [Suillus discolor]